MFNDTLAQKLHWLLIVKFLKNAFIFLQNLNKSCMNFGYSAYNIVTGHPVSKN